jgi:hypothetical protein
LTIKKVGSTTQFWFLSKYIIIQYYIASVLQLELSNISRAISYNHHPLLNISLYMPSYFEYNFKSVASFCHKAPIARIIVLSSVFRSHICLSCLMKKIKQMIRHAEIHVNVCVCVKNDTGMLSAYLSSKKKMQRGYSTDALQLQSFYKMGPVMPL